MEPNQNIPKRKFHVGILIKCTSTNRIFLLKRADNPFKNNWSILSGGLDEGEQPLEGLKREVGEEIKVDPNVIKYQLAWKENSTKGNSIFYFFKGYVDKEFKATLDEENLDSGWFDKDKLPSPLYPNLELKVAAI